MGAVGGRNVEEWRAEAWVVRWPTFWGRREGGGGIGREGVLVRCCRARVITPICDWHASLVPSSGNSLLPFRKWKALGTSLAVRWWRLGALTASGLGPVPGPELRSHEPLGAAKGKSKKEGFDDVLTIICKAAAVKWKCTEVFIVAVMIAHYGH